MGIKEKGEKAEAAFARWLNASGLGHVSICQNPETFAHLFKGALKRPDFLVLLDGLGVLAVDVKNYTVFKNRDGDAFSLKYEDELKKSIAFERTFRLPVWYVYMHEEAGQTTWYWISALKAVVEGVVRKNRQEDVEFLAIQRKHFVPVAKNADLSGLYTQRVSSYAKIKDMLP